ncbi:MAG: thiamine pyrophosphate-dependent enzyme [Fibrobacterota bacterium]
MNPLLRSERLPGIWCVGCGLHGFLASFANGVDLSRIPHRGLTVVSGIGCSGRAAGYLNLDGFHVTHGRAIPFATGLTLANPKLKAAVVSGEGDLFAIGGNHFIHAARRNMEMLVLCLNNRTFGMTGGEITPATPAGARAAAALRGNPERPFDLVKLATSAGATFVARIDALRSRELAQCVAQGLRHKGFAFIEVETRCPTYYGRRNGPAPSGRQGVFRKVVEPTYRKRLQELYRS